MHLSGTVTEMWRLRGYDLDLLGSGDVIGHVSVIVTMRLSSTVMEIWPFEVLPGTKVGRRSVLNITLISYTPLCYNGNVACEEYKTEMKQL